MALGTGLSGLLLVAAACTSGAPSSAPASTEQASEAASAAASEDMAASASAAASEGGAGPTVTITGLSSFGTDEITVAAGEQLTVVNSSGVSHTFTEGQNGGEADNPRVNEQIAADASVAVEFPEPGDYNVTCLFHSSMNMVVHVE